MRVNYIFAYYRMRIEYELVTMEQKQYHRTSRPLLISHTSGFRIRLNLENLTRNLDLIRKTGTISYDSLFWYN